MTFSAIVAMVMSLTNETSSTATTRVGTYVNLRYRAVVSSCGLQTSVNTIVTAPTVVGNRFVAFTCEKIFSVFDATQTQPAGILGEWSVDEMRNQPLGSDPAQHYAVYTMGATTVTIMLDCLPATIYTLTADAEVNITDLTGSGVPVLPADYHDLLWMGALADELTHLEKYDKAAYWEMKYDGGPARDHKAGRLADLRYFIATSNYRQIYQSKMLESGLIAQPSVS